MRLPRATAWSSSARQCADPTDTGLMTKQKESLAAMPARRSSFQLDAGGMSSRSTQASRPRSSSAAESLATKSRLSPRAYEMNRSGMESFDGYLGSCGEHPRRQDRPSRRNPDHSR